MEKNFDYKRAEAEINAKWLNREMFKTSVNPNKKPFTVIMPPPNITSRLHIGHAFGLTIKDAIVRFKRMQGHEALLLPGADHAAIATEVKVAEELRKQGIEKSDLSREEFLTHIHKWYDVYKGEITDQIKRMGVSCDWSKFSFTMDERTTKAVKTVFNKLYEKGLIYQGERMVNSCPGCNTALSDDEVEHEPREQILYNIAFSKEIVISTVRPEVVPTNVAIAVNPKDKRYKNFVGTSVKIPLSNREIPIIADDSVDMKFGTGCLQITPRHSMADFEIAKKHGLDLSPEMRLRSRAEEVERLKDFIVSTKKHNSNLSICYRCKGVVEPVISKQWFVAMEQLVKPAIDALKNKELKIQPKKFEKTYLHWLNNIKDWCISRQLISGHKIPIDGVDDVLDTWFSSALWPFCTLGWPDKTAEMDYFYPTQTMVMGYDILFFWAIRMVFSGIENTGKLPFDTLLFTGLVRDIKGQKMSKSLGNGIDPLDIVNEYGVDALRFSLICGTKLDRDPRYSIDKAVFARNFINKIWNATKFFMHTVEQENFDIQDFKIWDEIKNGKGMSIADKWICTRLNAIIKSINKKYEKYDFGVAANELQSFFWNDVCDWYLETIKVSPNKTVSLAVFRHVLINFLKMINPIMPFVTEEIYCDVLKLGDTMLFDYFPGLKGNNKDFNAERRQFEDVVELIQILRSQKKDNDGLKSVTIDCEKWLESEQATIEKLSNMKINFAKIDKADIVTKVAKIRLEIDKEAASAKIAKQIEQLKKEIERGEKMLSNQGFLARAPKALVDEENAKLATNKQLLKELGGNK